MPEQPKNRRAGWESLIVGGAETLKTGAIHAIKNTRDAVKQHGSGMRDELKNIAGSAASVPAEMVGSSLRSLTQLITLQPVNATVTAAKGLIHSIGHVRNAVLGLVPFATRTVGGGLSAGKNVVTKAAKSGGGILATAVKLPVTAPLAGIKAISGGLSRLGNWIAKIDPLKPGASSGQKSDTLAAPSAAKDNKHAASEALGIPIVSPSAPEADNAPAESGKEDKTPEQPQSQTEQPKVSAGAAPAVAAGSKTQPQSGISSDVAKAA